MKKTILILGIIFLLAGISINSSVAIFDFNDDTTPPVTTHSLDPATPDGNNGWYVSDVTVTLTATDDMSGVKEIKYKVNNGATQTIIGDNGIFIVDEDGDNLPIEYWAIDNVGNEESHHTFTIDMDQTKPVVDYCFEWFDYDEENGTCWYTFNVTATDVTSEMNRVEFFIDDGELYKIIYGPGPDYTFKILQDFDFTIKGYICKTNITDDYVKFFAIVITESESMNFSTCYLPFPIAYDNAGNDKKDKIIIGEPPTPWKRYFKWYKFPNDYEGEIGSYYIDAIFKKSPIKTSIVPNPLNFEPNNLFLMFLDHFPFLQRLLDIWRHVLV
jgi:hypothetical protein